MIHKHHLTVDVEEFFHASALEPWISRSAWDGIERRSPQVIVPLLEALASAGVRATFFVLGWLAEKEPAMVQAISDGGHEIASHGWDHRRVTDLSPEEFREDIRRSSGVLREISDQEVVGYRAPSFSILPGMEWALDTLLEEGIHYDSSMFPVKVHRGYGYPQAPPDPHLIPRPGGSIWEVPPATLRVGGLSLPAAGGAYLRFFPSLLVETALRSAEKRGRPGTVYLHPWELDTNPPSFQAPPLTKLRMRGGIGRMAPRLRRLMSRFQFRPIRDTLAELNGLMENSPK